MRDAEPPDPAPQDGGPPLRHGDVHRRQRVRLRRGRRLDFENDGDADLIATAFNDNHVASFRNSGGTFTRAGTMDVGDGRIDVAAVNGATNSLSIFRSGAQGTPTLVETHPLDGFPLAVDAGDLDGDGDLEVVTSDFDSGNFVIFDNEGGRFRRHPEELAAHTAASCAILHDRDNDGDLDITGIDEIDDLLLFENDPG